MTKTVSGHVHGFLGSTQVFIGRAAGAQKKAKREREEKKRPETANTRKRGKLRLRLRHGSDSMPSSTSEEGLYIHLGVLLDAWSGEGEV